MNTPTNTNPTTFLTNNDLDREARKAAAKAVHFSVAGTMVLARARGQRLVMVTTNPGTRRLYAVKDAAPHKARKVYVNFRYSSPNLRAWLSKQDEIPKFWRECLHNVVLDASVRSISAFNSFVDLLACMKTGYVPSLLSFEDDRAARKRAVAQVRNALAERGLPMFPPAPTR